MTKKRVTIAKIGYNWYEVRFGGVPKVRANSRTSAKRKANLIRKKLGRRIR